MASNGPKIEMSENYDLYNRNIERFNEALNKTISEIYDQLERFQTGLAEVQKRQLPNVDPAMLKALDEKLDGITISMNNTIASFNAAMSKINDSLNLVMSNVADLNRLKVTSAQIGDLKRTEVKVDSINTAINNAITSFNVAIGKLNEAVNTALTHIGELEKLKDTAADATYVKRVDDKVDKLYATLNSAISGVNSTVEKLNENYRDVFERLNKTTTQMETLYASQNKLSDDMRKTIHDFNTVSERINQKYDTDAVAISKLNEDVSKLYENLKNGVNTLNATDNELAEKINKVSETVYSGLPTVNELLDDVTELKKLNATINSRFDALTTATNALTVESNGLQLKLDTLGSEFENIVRAVGDSQKHVMDFINLAKSSMSTINAYNPESININVKKNQDRIETIEKEVTKALENYNNIDKSLISMSNRISDLSVVKNASKLFENVQSVSKLVEDSENHVSAQASKVEVMFNQISQYMNKFVDINNKLNNLSNRLGGVESELTKARTAMSLFATKDDMIDLHNKIDKLSREAL